MKRIIAQARKELTQIFRDRLTVALALVLPLILLALLGTALSFSVKGIAVVVQDFDQTPLSRRYIDSLNASLTFRVTPLSLEQRPDEALMAERARAVVVIPENFERDFLRGRQAEAQWLIDAVDANKLDAGLIVPADFAKQRERRETARMQLLIDAVNSNTAGIAGGYASRIIAALNERIAQDSGAVSLQVEGGAAGIRGRMAARIALLFNPGLESAWFIVTGVLGILLVLNGSIIGGASMVKEKEAGTIEQLLMTPAQAVEIVTAKIAPLFALLSTQIALALIVARLVFGLPIRGSLVLLFAAGMLCVLAGIGIGTFLATFSKSQQQAQLMSFFVNPPLSMLSGATTPIEAMPEWMQPFTLLNPISHFSTIARGVLLKGAGVEAIWPHMLALVGFAVALVGISAWRFRKQLG
jgi:ABC-2 type transport system permease protein